VVQSDTEFEEELNNLLKKSGGNNASPAKKAADTKAAQPKKAAGKEAKVVKAPAAPKPKEVQKVVITKLVNKVEIKPEVKKSHQTN
jgi:hypothetical protein